MADEKVFWVSTIFGAQSKKGIVRFELDGKELILLEPSNARELALNIITAAEAAEQEEFMYRFTKSIVPGTDAQKDQAGTNFVLEMRQFRTLRHAREQEGRQ